MRARHAPTRVLLEGRPGIGKTTVARRLVELLAAEHLPVTGFTTAEIRSGGTRKGFVVAPVTGGESVRLAHVDLPGPPRVGRYGVDLPAFERVALAALAAPPDGIVVLDELGPMELASTRFCERVRTIFAGRAPIVATVHRRPHPFTDELKARADVEVQPVTRANRDRLPGELAARLREVPRTGPAA